MAEGDKTNGLERAAILFLSLGEDIASEVMKHLGPAEIQKICAHMTEIENLDQEKLMHVAKEFANEMESKIALNGKDYIKKVLRRALGPGKAELIIDRIIKGVEDERLEALKWMEPKAVAGLIENEHPQTIAVVMAYLEPAQASKVISYLPPRLRTDVITRVATTESIGSDALRELEDAIEQELTKSVAVHNRSMDGIKRAAEILNQMGKADESNIISEIESTNGELATKIQKQMFVFADLAKADDKGIQMLLKEISTDQLVIALKVADDNLKEKFFKNMSERARDMLKEDMETMGPMKLSEVEKAQQDILAVARRLEQEGKMIIEGKGGEDVLV